MTYKSKLTRKGQSTIPVQLRRILGLKTGQYLTYRFVEERRAIEVKIMPDASELMGSLKSTKKYDKKAIAEAVKKYKIAEWKRKEKRST